MEHLLGIDLGTTGTKVAVVHPGQGVVAEATAPSGLSSPAAGWAEADPGQWWANVCALVPQVLRSAGLVAGDVAAVATTGMVPAVLLLDAGGQPLRPAILQNDARAVDELDALLRELAGLDLVTRTGSALTQQSVAPTLRWLARHEPDVLTATRWVVGSYDWALRALGAEPHLETDWAMESGLYTLDGGPEERVRSAAGCEAAWLAPVRAPGTPVGAVSARAAAATGLRAGTPLVVGGADHVASAYAAGLLEPGDTLVKLGGAGDVLTVSAEPVTDPRLYLDRHLVPDRWLPNGCMATSGSLLRWAQGLLGGDGITLEQLDAEAAAAGVGAGGVLCLPYFLGEKSPVHDPRARGAFVGLALGHGRGHLFRACLEAIAFGFRHNLEVLAEAGLAAGHTRVTNGGSRSTLWKQVVADVCDRPLESLERAPGASAGAAIAGGVGVGAMAWEDVTGLLRPGPTVEPQPAAVAAYAERYADFRALGDALTPISHRLSTPTGAQQP